MKTAETTIETEAIGHAAGAAHCTYMAFGHKTPRERCLADLADRCEPDTSTRVHPETYRLVAGKLLPTDAVGKEASVWCITYPAASVADGADGVVRLADSRLVSHTVVLGDSADWRWDDPTYGLFDQ